MVEKLLIQDYRALKMECDLLTYPLLFILQSEYVSLFMYLIQVVAGSETHVGIISEFEWNQVTENSSI